AGRLRRGDRPAPPGGSTVRGGGPADGPQPRQRGEGLGPGAGPAAPPARGVRMSTDERPAPADPGPGDDPADPRVGRAVREYQAAVEAGERPDRRRFLARHAEVADALAECLDALDFVHAAAGRLEGPAGGAAAAGPAAVDPSVPLGDFRIVCE